MARVRYLFEDLDTRQIIAELPLIGVSMDTKLNDWGVFRGTIHFDTTGIDNADIVAATTPGRTAIIVEREDTPIWDGIVWSSSYNSQSKSYSISARSYEAYADANLVDENLNYDFVEQRDIFRDLWLRLQAPKERNLSINVPPDFPGLVGRYLTVLASEYKTFLQVMSSISDGENGFDWTIKTIKEDNRYVRFLRIGYPYLGATDAAGLSFDYPGNVTNYYKTGTLSNAGTHLFLLGAGEGAEMSIGTAVQSDLIETGHKRFDLTIPRKDIESQAQLDALAAQLGTQRRPPLSVMKVFLKADLDPVFGSYGLGDAATVSIVDPRHPEGLTTTARIVAMSYRPQSDDSVEEAELIFEGDELNE